MNSIPTARQAKKGKLLEETRHLVRGLERISADSRWARRSSGYRGALLKELDWLEQEPDPSGVALARLEQLIETGYIMLIKAAREIQVEEPRR